MIRIILLTSALTFAAPATAQESGHHNQIKQGQSAAEASVTLSRTAEIDAAMASGGAPVVIEVLGAVCDFCVKSMNKTFRRHAAVKATYVNLDAKTLNIVLSFDGAMSDEEIRDLVKKSGYKAKAVHRADRIRKT